MLVRVVRKAAFRKFQVGNLSSRLRAVSVMCALWVGLGWGIQGLAQTAQPGQAPAPPAVASAAWYYERALVNFIFERYQEAELDLAEVLRKQPKSAEAYYLLAATLDRLKRPREATTALEQAVEVSTIEHVPARLRLVSHLLEAEKGNAAAPHVEKLLAVLRVPGGEVADARISLQMALSARPVKAGEIFALTQQLTGHINIFLRDSAPNYRAATLGRGLSDGLVMLEYINLLRRQPDLKDAEVAAETQKVATLRHGFGPAIFIQLGEVEEKQARLEPAVSAFDFAIRQMKYLSFSESKGDYSAEHFRELQKQVTKK